MAAVLHGAMGAITVTTLLLTDSERPGYVIAEHRRARTRLSVRLHASRLDRALAAGASPDSSAALSLRAAELIGDRARRDTARSLRRLVDEARHPRSVFRPCLLLCRRKVLRSRGALLELADRLVSPQPVDARAVAQTRLLLAGGGEGPLYRCPDVDDLEPAVQAVLASLEPRP